MSAPSPEWHRTDDGRLVCYPAGLEAGLLSSNLPDGEREANEALILAAPDMLDELRTELEAVLDDCRWADGAGELERLSARRDRLSSVIAKAEGR